MLRLGVVTDIHAAARDHGPSAWHNRYDRDRTLARLEAALRAFVAAGADAVAVLGDVTDRGESEAFAAAADVFAGCPLPLVLVPGNHDLQGEGPPPAWAAGGAPRGVAAVRLHGRWPADGDLGFVIETSPANGAPLVALSHYPVLSRRPRLDAAGLKYAGDLGCRPQLERALRDLDAPVVAFCGHLHVRDAIASGGLLQLGFGALVEYPYEAALVEVDGAVVRRRCFSVSPRDDGHEANPALVPAEQEWKLDSGGWTPAGG